MSKPNQQPDSPRDLWQQDIVPGPLRRLRPYFIASS